MYAQNDGGSRLKPATSTRIISAVNASSRDLARDGRRRRASCRADLIECQTADPGRREVPVPMRLHVREVERVAAHHPEQRHVDRQARGDQQRSGDHAQREGTSASRPLPPMPAVRVRFHYEGHEEQDAFDAGQRGEAAEMPAANHLCSRM